ncbi:MAG: hypothetical protein KatS3mg110_4325 [Pirellulaceae bacterium]|nr:MAG: hypothetical protein KatS3mg110_4325 [Pirellulaceae bacterium]
MAALLSSGLEYHAVGFTLVRSKGNGDGADSFCYGSVAMPAIYFDGRHHRVQSAGSTADNGLASEQMNRKEFLGRFLLWSTAGAAWLRLASTSAAEDAGTWKVALLADTHIPADPVESYRGFQPVENLKTVAPQILDSEAQAVFLLGDAARLAGLPGDYERLEQLLSPIAARVPVVIGLGNHDDRDNFFRRFPVERSPGEHPGVPGKHVTIVEHPVLRVVMLDSLLYVNKVAGLLGKVQRAWLERWLPISSDRPLVLMVHHTLGDGDSDLLDVDRLMAMVKRHEHVKAIFYGHSHRYAVEQRDGLQLVNLAACGYNFSDQEPVGWTLARFDKSGVDLTLHAIGGNRRQDGHTQRVNWLR